MFDSLSSKLSQTFDRLFKRGVLSEDDVDTALREIRIALLEADVALPVVRYLMKEIKEKTVGQSVVKSVRPTQMVVKIVHDTLVSLLSCKASDINLNAPSPFSYLIIGLQGAGKTTSVAKLGRYLKEKERKKPLLVSLDIYRPAAQKQLELLAEQSDLLSLEIIENERPLEIIERALQSATKHGIDVILFDTAGRLHIDEDLMKELDACYKRLNPIETLLVADSLMGQDAIQVAQTFKERIPLTGLILTRIDGDGRGGAALSFSHITETPVKFLGVGEKAKDFEVFNAERIATRILDMGDIVSLVESASQVINEKEALKMANRVQSGIFDLTDMHNQLQQMLKMGGLSTLLNLLPGGGMMKKHAQESGIDDRILRRQIAIIQSMTQKERKNPRLLNASRRKRIAAGAGQVVADVNKLMRQFEQMQTVMKKLKGGDKGFMRGLQGLMKR